MVRCPACRTVAPVRDVRRTDEPAPAPLRSERPAPPRKRPRAARKSGTDTTKVFILVAVGGFVLFGCLAAGGVGYFLSSGGSIVGPSAREQVVGNWETDPDATRMQAARNPLGVGFHVDLGLTFNADQTFHQRHILNLNGRWSIESAVGKSARVRMVVRFGELDSDPIYANVTFIDQDHIDWDQNGVTMRYRRVGTTSPSPNVPITPSVTPRVEGPGGGPGDRFPRFPRESHPDPIRPRGRR